MLSVLVLEVVVEVFDADAAATVVVGSIGVAATTAAATAAAAAGLLVAVMIPLFQTRKLIKYMPYFEDLKRKTVQG